MDNDTQPVKDNLYRTVGPDNTSKPPCGEYTTPGLCPVAEVSIIEEPGAVVPHAGICEGDVWATGVPTSPVDQITKH